MQNKHVINIVASDCRPEEENKFNSWYDEVHIPFFLKFSGLLSVARYKLAGTADRQARYLAVYEFASREDLEKFSNSPEVAAARAEMRQTWGEKGIDIKWRAPYELLRRWQT
jgi:antibiotic biosynthesis monooxygenase (ABM) superfamily enzyme